MLGQVPMTDRGTVEDLRALRKQLARDMAVQAYELTRGLNQRGLERLVTLNEAIYALDDLIESNVSEPSRD